MEPVKAAQHCVQIASELSIIASRVSPEIFISKPQPHVTQRALVVISETQATISVKAAHPVSHVRLPK
jgi:hypothetical protein